MASVGTFLLKFEIGIIMKIRMKDQSLRLRLSQSEVHQLHERGIVKRSIQFGPKPEQILTYGVEASSSNSVTALFEDHHILVSIPSDVVQKWATSDQVSIKELLNITSDQTLLVLVEKDFKCLTVRPDENESDLFPHPKEGEGHH